MSANGVQQYVTADEAARLLTSLIEIQARVNQLTTEYAQQRGTRAPPDAQSALYRKYWQTHEELVQIGHRVYAHMPTATQAAMIRSTFESATNALHKMASAYALG